MQRILRLLLACLLLPAMLLAGCSSSPSQESSGQYLDDTVISTKVRAALVAERARNATEISVETFKGVVQLSGFVSSQEAIDKAVATARGVTGVRSVKNALALKSAQ